mgnify:CR=1 FL=1
MIATIINAAAVIAGALIGLVLGKKFTEEKQTLVMTGAGIVTLLIGIYMALKTTAFVELVLALIIGGLLGAALKIEDSVEKLGVRLERRFMKKSVAVDPVSPEPHFPTSGNQEPEASGAATGSLPRAEAHEARSSWNFPKGFLDASVLFCAGAMTILGAIEAGVNKNYTLLLTKSVLDGFLALVFASVYGPGVAFSALSILVYQGVLTWLGIFLQPVLSDVIMTGISGAGGCLVLMIGLNLLKLKKIKTADFLPALVLMPLFLTLEKVIIDFLR